LPSDCCEKLGNLTKSFNRKQYWNIIFNIQDILRRQTNSSPFSSEDWKKSLEICLLQDTSQDSRTNKQTQNPSSRLSAIALKKKP
jgi:hypothetical protein